uniref:Integrase catalytic domain-containing protein n=1 Tax=Meloidogyne incognita TaxID=6306 RepID=A0A914MXS7_MELIC
MPGLPRERLIKSRAFEAIGVDYLGPSLYKIENGKAKFWIVLFTCFTTRAVHLEIALELSALEFLHCLRRFIASRGCPKKILSDNANQFKVVSELIGAKLVGKWVEKQTNDEKRLNNFLINKGIEWCFIPSLSPWAGGVYERLVKLVKDSFKRTLGGVILNLEELRTFIKEVEFSINCRPISFVSGEMDGPSCLRPVDFLLPNIEIHENINESDGEEEFKIGKLSMGDQLRVRLKATQKAFEKFWTRWTREYLLILRDKSKWTHNNDRTSLKREPRVGEVVIVQQEGQPRNTWSLGKIIELDGSPPKSAKVQIGKRCLVRPVNKLFPMEAENDVIKNGEEKSKNKLENSQNIDGNKNENKNKDKEQNSINNNLKGVKNGENKLKNKNNIHPMVTRAKKAALILTIINLFLLMPFVSLNPTYLVSCRGCRMKCRNFGLLISVGSEIDKVEVCCMGTCIIETNGLEHLELGLPKDVTALDYRCRAKYINGRRIFRGSIFCPAVDPCLRITEIWERILNPQCESTKTITIVGIFLAFMLCLLISGMVCACRIFSILGKIFLIIWRLIKTLVKISSKKDGKIENKDLETLIDRSHKLKKINRIKRNRRLNRLGLLNIIIFIIFMEIVKADIEVISIQAKSEDCYRNKNLTTCKITTTNTLTLLPDGQVISLTLKNDKGMIMGEMEFIMNSLSIKCNQKSQRQLRSYELKVGSVKRCPAQGTCKAGRCQHIRSKENVEELDEWIKKPGNSYCVEGHALWGYQCGLPGAACYFYKVYAEPISDELYELVSCPTWDYVIDIEMSMRFKGNISKYSFSLSPGATIKWDKIKISLLDITPPMAPILSSQFIIGNNGVAMVDNFKSDLDCSDAKNFSKCELDINSCKECWLDKEEEQIKCACIDLIIEEIFKDKQKSLPLDTKRIKLRNNGRNIYSETSYLPIEIMVRFENYSIASNIDISICKIEPIILSGCYNCFGAIFKYKCFSDYGNPLSEIKCKNGNIFTSKCSVNGTEQVSVLSFDRTEVREFCEIFCPGGKTNFTIQGTLEYILPEKAKIIVKNGTPSLYTMESAWGGIFDNSWTNFKLLDIQGLFWEMMNLKIISIGILVIIIIYFILKIFLKVNPMLKMYRLIITSCLLLITNLGAGGFGEIPPNFKNFVEMSRGHYFCIKSSKNFKFYSLSKNPLNLKILMAPIPFTQFAANILNCDLEDVYGRLYFSRLDRSTIANEARKVENNNGNIYCSTNEFSCPRGVITGLAEWVLVDDNKNLAVYPEQIPPQWWSELVKRNRMKTQNFFYDEEVSKTIDMGPGIELENPLRGVLEFYPLEGLEIEEYTEEEIPDMDRLNINIGNNNNIQNNYGSQTSARATMEVEEKLTVTMEANSDLHCSSSGSEVSTVEVKVKAKLFRGPLLGILFLCLVVGTWTPAMAAPNSNTPTTPLGDSNLDMEDPEAFEELCDAFLGPTNSVPHGEEFIGPTLVNGNGNQGSVNTNNNTQMYSIFDQLMDNWATRQHQQLPTTSTTTTRPIQFVPQTTTATQQNPTTIQQQQRQNVGGPIRARRQPRQNLNQGCFICHASDHFAKYCPVKQPCSSNTLMQRTTSATINTHNQDTQTAMRSVATQLTRMSQQWPNIPAISAFLLQMAQFILLALDAPRRH